MPEQKKPVMLKLPDNIGSMSRDEIDAWLENNADTLRSEVANDKAE